MNENHPYYSSSILSTYLNDSESTLHTAKQVPQIQIDQTETNDKGPSKSYDDWDSTVQSVNLKSPPTSSRSRFSTISSTSTNFSSRSSCSGFSDDLDLQSLKLKLEVQDTADKHSGFKKFKQRFLRQNPLEEPKSLDEKFFKYVQEKLRAQLYHYEKNSKLQVDFEEAAEVFFFGDTIDKIFPDEGHLINYLVESTYELGEIRFSNLSKFHENRPHDIEALLHDLQPNLARFNTVLDLYAESDSNIQRPELFETFSDYANQAEGLCMPLAVAMFGNWLLSFNKDSALKSNYENTLILDVFRKAARLGLVLRKAQSVLEKHSNCFDKIQLLELSRYWGKDNRSSLSISLHGLGEYYQYIHEHDIAVTLWEMNCHLTGDADSGQLAILGLTDGYGFGNHSKEHNRFGKKSKTHKFNTKRRIAQLYRVLLQDPTFNEYGISWATKEKYD